MAIPPPGMTAWATGVPLEWHVDGWFPREFVLQGPHGQIGIARWDGTFTAFARLESWGGAWRAGPPELFSSYLEAAPAGGGPAVAHVSREIFRFEGRAAFQFGGDRAFTPIGRRTPRASARG